MPAWLGPAVLAVLIASAVLVSQAAAAVQVLGKTSRPVGGVSLLSDQVPYSPNRKLQLTQLISSVPAAAVDPWLQVLLSPASRCKQPVTEQRLLDATSRGSSCGFQQCCLALIAEYMQQEQQQPLPNSEVPIKL